MTPEPQNSNFLRFRGHLALRPALRLASRPAEDLPVSTNLPLSADLSQLPSLCDSTNLLLSANFPRAKAPGSVALATDQNNYDPGTAKT